LSELRGNKVNFAASIGIKQVVRYEWMEYTLKLLTSGMQKDEIRKELEIYLSEKKGSGETGKRADYTMSLAVTVLMNTWITPKEKLLPYRDKWLCYAEKHPMNQIGHWSMISAAYPFWFNICYAFGSLFKLQDKIKKSQIMNRIYEVLGERNTVERCSRYVIRSLVSWGIIKDLNTKGFYEKGNTVAVNDMYLTSLLLESALYAIPDEKFQLSSLLNCPSFFNFRFPVISGLQISRLNGNIRVEQYSLDNEYLSLKSTIQ
jgi:hypothetical protein